jgi:serine protease AprX
MFSTRAPHRLVAAVALAMAVITAPAIAAAPAHADTAVTSDGLLAAAQQQPGGKFHVVVQATTGSTTADLASTVQSVLSADPASFAGITDTYALMPALAADLSGSELLSLVTDPRVATVTSDSPVVLTSVSTGGFSNQQQWPVVPQATKIWGSDTKGATIAVVDSGIEQRADFGSRIAAAVDLTSGSGANSPGDGFGHGTFVAGIASGAGDGYAGASPRSKIVSLDVMDDTGMARTSDVIAAADWIFTHRRDYNIRVANFSLTSSVQSSFMYDPLDKAVEALWQSGVVVVAAAGNYASNGDRSGVLYAPGNDPFVITVGAADIAGTSTPSDDFAAPWSAWGSTPDGFGKPELCAPGRSMNGPAPTSSTIYTQHPERTVAPGYMWMSGTSFSAPVVAGAASWIAARHTGWTPDQIKGALMEMAAPTSDGTGKACGVGELRAGSAAADTSPPNPNLALNRFLVTTSGSPVPVFDAASWADAAKADASWADASWSSASWADASWDTASWADASWADASWASASWSAGTTSDGSLPASAALIWAR